MLDTTSLGATRRTRVWRIVVSALLVTSGLAAVVWFVQRDRPVRLTIEPKPAGVALAWPLDRTWRWTFPLPSGNDAARLALTMRQRSRQDDGTRNFRPTPMSFEEADHIFTDVGLDIPGPKKRVSINSGSVTLQLIDLAEIGAASSKPAQTLRVLANLNVGPVSADLRGEKAVLPAGRLGGWGTEDQQDWKNGELYLARFYIVDGPTLYEYDVLLVTSQQKIAQRK